MNEIYSTIETITPEMAKKYLENNMLNRKLSKSTVRIYMRDIENKAWNLNGESIKFTKSGTLIDGQHRLMAIIKTNIPVQTFVTRNLPEDSYTTIDRGKKRALSDALQISGKKNWAALAASLLLLFHYNRFKEGDMRIWSEGNLHTVTNTELLELLKKSDGIEYSAQIASSKEIRFFIPPSVTGLCHYIFSKIDKNDADIFFKKLSTGEGLGRGNPILTVRELLLRNKASKNRIVRSDMIIYIFKAWNKFRRGEKAFKFYSFDPFTIEHIDKFPFPI
jgi:hypothetical protein